MEWSGDAIENVYLAAMALVAASLAWNGWRQGVVRQAMTLVAVACAYAAGWFGGPAAAPAFAFLKYAQPVTIGIAGTVTGLVTFIVVRGVSGYLFKPTSEQRPGGRRTSYGVFGGVLGLVFAGLLFIVVSDVIRLVGAVAKSNLESIEREKVAHPALAQSRDTDAGALLKGIAKLGTALDEGGSREVFQRVDPVPPNVYATVLKIGIMVSRPEAMDRFRAYPGVATLTEHPKLNALLNDSEVGRLVNDRSYLKLLRNEKVVALASDSEFAEQVRRMDLDGALRHALGQPAEDLTR